VQRDKRLTDSTTIGKNKHSQKGYLLSTQFPFWQLLSVFCIVPKHCNFRYGVSWYKASQEERYRCDRQKFDGFARQHVGSCRYCNPADSQAVKAASQYTARVVQHWTWSQLQCSVIVSTECQTEINNIACEKLSQQTANSSNSLSSLKRLKVFSVIAVPKPFEGSLQILWYSYATVSTECVVWVC